MKKFFYLVLSFVIAASFFISCDDDTKDPITPTMLNKTDTVTIIVHDTVDISSTYKFSAKLSSDLDVNFENFIVSVAGTKVLTDKDGVFVLKLTEGKYKITLEKNQFSYYSEGKNYVLSAKDDYDVEITKDYDTSQTFNIVFDSREKNPVVITEFYRGASAIQNGKDAYIKLYNNSSANVSFKNFCFGICFPYLSNNKNYDAYSTYAVENYTPATQGIWYIDEISFLPYEEKVFVIYSAEDYTSNNGVNLNSDEYYCLIDMTSAFNNKNYYTQPSVGKVKFNVETFGLGNTWQIGKAPALFIFSTGDISPSVFANNPANQVIFDPASTTWGKLTSCLKIPNKNVIDGFDIKNSSYSVATNGNINDCSKNYNKRFPDVVDRGFVVCTDRDAEFSYYRNVDKEATEALEENKGKLVYNYHYGTLDVFNAGNTDRGSTDPSGIDAQASIKNGAHIIYLDTDNSSNDFHQRSQATLKD